MERQEITVPEAKSGHGGQGTASLDLSRFQTAFCDSLAALDAAYDKGLDRTATILTRSPALAARDDLPCVHLDTRDGFDRDVLEKFYLTTSSFLEECLNVLKSDPLTSPFAVLFCREIWHWQQRALFAAFLFDEDLVEPRLIIDGVPNKKMPERFCLPWRKWLAGNPALCIFETETKLPSGWPAEAEDTPLRQRLRLQGPEQILFRLSTKLGRYIPSSIMRGQVYYLRESEMVRDACVEFAKRGFGIARFKFQKKTPVNGQHPVCDRAFELVADCFSQRLAEYFPAGTASPLTSELQSSFSRQLHAYDMARGWLQDNAGQIFQKKKVVILTNYPFGGDQLALVHIADEQGAVFTGVQHGIGRELLAAPQNACNYENTFTRNAIVFNEEAKRITAAGAFRSDGGDECIAGGPSDFRRVGTLSRADEGVPPILYAQMLGQTGSFFNGSVYKDDVESSHRDISLITQVFEKLPHAVGFKCYPHRSYEDLDPALEVAEKAKNVNLLRTGQDLRYLVSRTKIVISVGASSTLAWCLGSGSPVVYIDPLPAGYRLRSDILDEYTSAFFYFDERDDGYLEKMRTFLSRPLDDIRHEWEKGEIRRRDFADRFFGKVNNRSGKNMADWLLSRLPS